MDRKVPRFHIFRMDVPFVAFENNLTFFRSTKKMQIKNRNNQKYLGLDFGKFCKYG